MENLKEQSFSEKELSFEEKLSLVQKFVKKNYEQGGVPPETVERFNAHNETILNYASELAEKEKLKNKEIETLKLAVALHDVSKISAPLVKHGFEGAKVAYEYLLKNGFNEEVVNKIKDAIERHMGPIPGFMANEAKKWEEKTKEKIEFPRPKTKLDELLYDADMLSLIDQQGIEKILIIRKNVKVFQEEDKKVAAEQGITQEEAAWLSALKSGKEAADSLFTKSARRKAEQLLKEAEKVFKEFKKRHEGV